MARLKKPEEVDIHYDLRDEGIFVQCEEGCCKAFARWEDMPSENELPLLKMGQALYEAHLEHKNGLVHKKGDRKGQIGRPCLPEHPQSRS